MFVRVRVDHSRDIPGIPCMVCPVCKMTMLIIGSHCVNDVLHDEHLPEACCLIVDLLWLFGVAAFEDGDVETFDWICVDNNLTGSSIIAPATETLIIR